MKAGIEGYTNKSTSSDGTTTWTGYTGGKLVLKSEQQVWNYITRDRAKMEAESLYDKEKNNVASKLCSSYAWDTMLKFIDGKTGTYSINSTGENCSGNGGLKATGYNKIKNIYDIGGNVNEWTTESYSDSIDIYVGRGGFYDGSANDYPAAIRGCASTTYAVDNVGFRVTLYM